MNAPPLWYVATAFRNVLVPASNADDARRRGWPLLYQLYADVRERLGCEVPVEIVTVRPATPAEIELQRFHDEHVGLVHKQHGCPMCGQRESDLLVWITNDEVQCHGCGTVYSPFPDEGC